ncbi:MAG: hypothetical protein LBL81_02875 [Tannerella sp.]|nr:hypothetical protein [Tannerella sp.]
MTKALVTGITLWNTGLRLVTKQEKHNGIPRLGAYAAPLCWENLLAYGIYVVAEKLCAFPAKPYFFADIIFISLL